MLKNQLVIHYSQNDMFSQLWCILFPLGALIIILTKIFLSLLFLEKDGFLEKKVFQIWEL